MATIPEKPRTEYVATRDGPRRVSESRPVFPIAPVNPHADTNREIAARVIAGKMPGTVRRHNEQEHPA